MATATKKLSPEAAVKAKRSEEKEKKSKTNKVSRIKAAVLAIQGMNGKSVNTTDLVKTADKIYVKAGGPSNEKEALWSIRTTIQTMAALNMITVSDGKVSKTQKSKAA